MKVVDTIYKMPKYVDWSLPDWAQAEEELELYEGFQCNHCGYRSFELTSLCTACGENDFDVIEMTEDRQTLSELEDAYEI